MIHRGIVRALQALASDDIEMAPDDELRIVFDLAARLGLARVEHVGTIDVFAITDAGRAELAA